MLDFLIPKTKVQAYNFREIPIETLEIMGISQVNPYCNAKTENELFITVVSFANESKEYDEKEGMVLTKYFAVRKCPRCKGVDLIPVNIRINMDTTYQKHEEEIAFDAYEERPLRRHFPTTVNAFCNNCSSCFEIRIKSKDTWIKQAKKIKEKELIGSSWEEFCID